MERFYNFSYKSNGPSKVLDGMWVHIGSQMNRDEGILPGEYNELIRKIQKKEQRT